MSESLFEGFEIGGYDIDADEPPESPEGNPSKIIDSVFTVIVDTREQEPYLFRDVIGDHRDANAQINVRTIRKQVKPAGDYGIVDMPGIAIERKSKADLFGSVNSGPKRENFLARLHKMQAHLKYGAVIIECTVQELFDDPPIYTAMNPKAVFRATLSWEQQFPLIHWHWCQDRDQAEQITFRILEKFYEQNSHGKYKHHNKPLDQANEALKAGIVARGTTNEFQIPYSQDNALRVSWLCGWEFYSSHFLGGDRGTLYEIGQLPPSTLIANSFLQNKEKKRKPLPGQKSFIKLEGSSEADDMSELTNKVLDNPITDINQDVLIAIPGEIKKPRKRKTMA